MTIERAFTILAALLVVIAALCLWYDNVSAAFVLGALGAVAWFLSYRFRLRARFPVTEDEKDSTEDVGGEIHDEDLSDHSVER